MYVQQNGNCTGFAKIPLDLHSTECQVKYLLLPNTKYYMLYDSKGNNLLLRFVVFLQTAITMEIALVMLIPVYRTIVIVGQALNALEELTALEKRIAASPGIVNVGRTMNAREQNFASLVNVEVCDCQI